MVTGVRLLRTTHLRQLNDQIAISKPVMLRLPPTDGLLGSTGRLKYASQLSVRQSGISTKADSSRGDSSRMNRQWTSCRAWDTVGPTTPWFESWPLAPLSSILGNMAAAGRISRLTS